MIGRQHTTVVRIVGELGAGQRRCGEHVNEAFAIAACFCSVDDTRPSPPNHHHQYGVLANDNRHPDEVRKNPND